MDFDGATLTIPPERYVRLLRELRLLEADFSRQARKGRRPSARAVELGIKAVGALVADYPDREGATWAALAWLARKRAELAFLGGRAA